MYTYSNLRFECFFEIYIDNQNTHFMFSVPPPHPPPPENRVIYEIILRNIVETDRLQVT